MSTNSEQLFRLNVIGQPGSGKSALAGYLAAEHGFEIFRPSDSIRNYAKEHQLTLSGRADYVKVHQQMLQENPSAMTDGVARHPADRLCIDGMRVPAHVDILRRITGMLTLALDCPREVRFERVMAAREWRQYRDESNITTIEDFAADEAADNDLSNPHAPNVKAIMELADYTIDACQPLAAVHREAAGFLVRHGIDGHQ